MPSASADTVAPIPSQSIPATSIPATPQPTQPIDDSEELRQAVAALFTGENITEILRVYGNIEAWDVSRVTDFSELFAAQLLGRRRRLKNISDDDNLSISLSSLHLSEWNVSSGVDFTSMFEGAFDYHGDLSAWDVGQGQDFTNMFRGAELFNSD